MECLLCGGETKITHTRRKNKHGEKFYRERVCVQCGEKFKTYEIHEIALFDVLDEMLPEKKVDEIVKKLFQNLRGDSAET